LSEADVKNIKTHCDRYEPRVRAYGGIKYEMYKLSSKISPDKVRDEIKTKQPLYVTYRPNFKAPASSSINSTVMKEIGSGNFAAVLSGYFYAPLTSNYVIKFSSDEKSALYMNPDAPSIAALAEKKLEWDIAISPEGYTVNLTAGVPYYIALYQVSSGTNVEAHVGFQAKCDYGAKFLTEESITKMQVVHKFSHNCSDIAEHIRDAPDDLYTVRLQSTCHATQVYCQNMRGVPDDPSGGYLEYLSLPKISDNYAYYHRPRLVNFDTCSGTETEEPSETQKFYGETWFRRVRINPTNMLLVRDDYRHAYTTGNPVKYGTAGDCYSKSTEDCRKGRFKINLAGTGVHMNERKWVATGFPKDMSERITQFQNSADWKTVSGHCGGSCSECEPSEGHIRITPDICEAAAPDPATQDIASGGRKKAKSRSKRRWFSRLYNFY